MKKYILWAALLMLIACNSKQTPEAIEEQINEYRKEINDINIKIAELQKELESLDPETKDAASILVAYQEVTPVLFDHYIKVSGTAEAVNEAYISPSVSGQIMDIYVEEGDHVKKGQLLAKLNTEVTESSISEVQSQLELARVVYEKQQRLWEKNIGSEIQYLNAKTNVESLEKKLETLQAQVDLATITSPVNGIVDKIYHKKGELALPGIQLMVVVNLDEVYINAPVSEAYLSSVSQGEQVRVEFPVYPDLTMEVPVYRKSNIINPNNRTFDIQLKIKNPDARIKPNLLAIIYMIDFTAEDALVVPSIIVKQDIVGNYVYVVENNSNKTIARKVYIETGMSYGNETMVTKGLSAGDRVIVKGYNQVSDGTEVRVDSTDVS